MSVLNLQLNCVAYSDSVDSNNPSIRNFDLLYKKFGQPASKPKSEAYTVAPGSSQLVFSGIRTTGIDSTTAFSMSVPYLSSPNRFRFSNVSGTAPAFRTLRAIGVDSTTVISVTINGPIAIFASTSGTAMVTSSVQVGDVLKVDIGSGFSASNQGNFVVLAKSANSLSVQNTNGLAQSATILDASKFIVYSNGGSNNQIQIGDKVVINAGFSIASWGTYEIEEVTPSYFDVLVSQPAGLPIESDILPGTTGLVFYQSAKSFVFVAAQQRCSVRVNMDTTDNNLVEPLELDNPEKPAVFLKDGTVYALTINNLSLEPLNIIVATAE